MEDEESVGGAKTYGNVVAVKKGNEDKDSIKALIKALKSDAVKKYMEKEYKARSYHYSRTIAIKLSLRRRKS